MKSGKENHWNLKFHIGYVKKIEKKHVWLKLGMWICGDNVKHNYKAWMQSKLICDQSNKPQQLLW